MRGLTLESSGIGVAAAWPDESLSRRIREVRVTLAEDWDRGISLAAPSSEPNQGSKDAGSDTPRYSAACFYSPLAPAAAMAMQHGHQ